MKRLAFSRFTSSRFAFHHLDKEFVMRLGHHISDKQETFMRHVRDGSMTLQEVRAAENLDNAQITRWMKNEFFWDALKFAVREARRHRRLELEVAANVASRTLVQLLVQGLRGNVPLEEWKVKLLLETIWLAERLRGVRAGAGGRDGRRRLKRPLEEDLCHPDAKEREGELLALMRREELKVRAI